MGWFSDEGDLARAFKAWTKLGVSSPLPSSTLYPLKTVAEAKAFCRALASPNIYARYASGRMVLFDLLTFFQDTKSEEAKRYLRDRGLPVLRRILTRALQERGAADAAGERDWRDAHAFLVKILSMYNQPGDASLIAQAARDPRFSDEFLWLVIFEIIADGHPAAVEICEGLADPLPGSEMLANYLGFANRLCREGRISKHPFDCPVGIASLSSFMSDATMDGLAIWVAASLPYIDPPAREALLDRATQHVDPRVRIKAAWAMAKLDMDVGRARLVAFCGDARYSKFTAVHLDELGLADLVPAETREPDFAAMARMCDWLAHPREYGRPPDEISQYDTRELNWPPHGGQPTRLWLFKYRYAPTGEGTGEERIGFAGPFPFSLARKTGNLSPEDAYGLYCCDGMSSDPRVPDRPSAAIGRKLIAELNPDFPAT